jgi:hypothetical protein
MARLLSKSTIIACCVGLAGMLGACTGSERQQQMSSIDALTGFINSLPDVTGDSTNIGDRTKRPTTALTAIIAASALAEEQGLFERGMLTGTTTGQAAAMLLSKARMESGLAPGIRANACDEDEREICAMGLLQIMPQTAFSVAVQMDARDDFPSTIRPRNLETVIGAIFDSAIANSTGAVKQDIIAQRRAWRDGRTGDIQPGVLENTYELGAGTARRDFRQMFLPDPDGPEFTHLQYDGVDVMVDLSVMRNAYVALWLNSTYNLPADIEQYLIDRYGRAAWVYLGHQTGEGTMRDIGRSVYALDHEGGNELEERSAYVRAINRAEPSVNPYFLKSGARRGRDGVYPFSAIRPFEDIVTAIANRQGSPENIRIVEEGITAFLQGEFSEGMCLEPTANRRQVERRQRGNDRPERGPYVCRIDGSEPA